MRFSPEKREGVKAWVVKRLEDISDADSDVLGDYVLALLTSDEPDEKIMTSCLENLDDFLKENTKQFVADVFAKYGSQSKAKKSSLPPKPNLPNPKKTNPTAQAVRGGRGGRLGANNGPILAGRKRTLAEQETSSVNQPHQVSDRPTKTAKSRHRGKKSRQQNVKIEPGLAWAQTGMPIQGFQAGFPTFDPNDPTAPMRMFASFQQMMQILGMGGTQERCLEYDTKGFCSYGNACPFKHGEDTTGYPMESPMDRFERARAQELKLDVRERRANMSGLSQRFDTYYTTLGVALIPPFISEEEIREFFSQFGKVAEVKMQRRTFRCSVRFEDHDSAQRAYDSPKKLIDDSSIRTYWYDHGKENRMVHAGTGSYASRNGGEDDEETKIDIETFSQQQLIAQQAFEERMAKVKENQEARRQLKVQQQELLAKHEAEMKSLRVKLAKAEAKRNRLNGDLGTTRDGEESSAQSALDTKSLQKEKVQKALREQLTLLEAEARLLGIDPDAPVTSAADTSYGAYYSHARGGYRGRGSYRGRGRGGVYMLRSHGSGSVLRLDNRPRRVAITFPEGTVLDAEKDETLRHHLFSISPFQGIDQDPDKPQGRSVIVTYAERFQAEMLIDKGRNIPGIGDVEMRWVAGPVPAQQTNNGISKLDGHGDDGDAHMTDDTESRDVAAVRRDRTEDQHLVEIDYDVASEDEYDGIA